MDLTKWLKLWDADPELRPMHCDECFSVMMFDRGFPAWDKSNPSGHAKLIPATQAAALIRDKAVWWLAHKDLGPQISSAATFHPDDGSPPVDTLWCVELFGINDEGDEEFLNADPTEALYLAVCKVLEVEP